MGEDSKSGEPAPSVLPPGPRLPPGAQFGRYQIVRELGAGGMGSVYEAVLTDLKKRVALKLLSPDLAHKDEYRLRFVREGRAAARIRHPNVVEIFDVGVHDNIPFLAMEYLVGQDLRARFDKGALPPQELLDLLLPVLAAVITAHDAQVIHRDLKPENIFLNEEPTQGLQPVVLDFGISKVLDDDAANNLTATSSMMGTPLYMSPEQVRGSREVDARTDQYALGVVLYEGLTGTSAFTGNSVYDLLLKKIEGAFVPLREQRPELPAALCAAVERAMAADRDKRYSDLRAFANALLPFAGERTRLMWGASLSLHPSTGGAAAGPVTESERVDSTLRSSVKELPALSRRSSSTRRWQVAGAVLAALGAGFIGLRFGARPAKPEDAAAQVPAAASSLAPEPSAPVVPRVYDVRVSAIPAEAQFVLDGEPAGTGTLVRTLPLDGKTHSLEVSAAGFETQRLTFTDRAPQPEVKLVALPAEAPAPQPVAAPAPTTARPRKAAEAKRAANTPALATPVASPAPASETPRRPTTGSNDAPVLY